jgi:hypothetical protein
MILPAHACPRSLRFSSGTFWRLRSSCALASRLGSRWESTRWEPSYTPKEAWVQHRCVTYGKYDAKK